MADPTLPSSIEFVNEQEQEFFAEDLIWLRKVDGTKWTKLDSESITRDDERECAFHHRWFTKVGHWDQETN